MLLVLGLACPTMARSSTSAHETKWCTRCGREIEWRKKWERDWDSVKWCSSECRRRGLTDLDRTLERAILDLLQQRSRAATICPSEAARSADPDGWESIMEDTRCAARRLVVNGSIDIVQKGAVVDPSTAKGPIRLRLR